MGTQVYNSLNFKDRNLLSNSNEMPKEIVIRRNFIEQVFIKLNKDSESYRISERTEKIRQYVRPYPRFFIEYDDFNDQDE